MIEILIILIGLSVGSFINVVISRIPENISIINPPSRCPVCEKRIKNYDNIPIISYLILKGRCRYCKNIISIRYPLVEAVTAILFFTAYLRFGFNAVFFLSIFLISVLISIFFIDLKHLIIPDRIIYPCMVITFILLVLMEISGFKALPVTGNKGILASLTGFLLGGGFLYLLALISPLVFKKEGMGGGDIKLISLIGLFFGLYVFLTLFISFFLGAVFGILIIYKNKKSRKDEIPFGPFIALAGVITIFAGEQIFNFYLKFIGY